MRTTLIFVISLILLCAFFVGDLFMGSVHIPFDDIVAILKGNGSKQTWEYIILNFRLPKALTAIVTGAGISVAGLQMQTLFKNPLAGPSVIGITHGASLGVALFVMSSTALFGGVLHLQNVLGDWGLIIFAVLGAFLVLSCVLLASVRMSDNISVLLIGIMFSFVTGSIVNILQYFSSPELIQNFLIWSFGSLSGVTWAQFNIMAPVVVVALVFSLMLAKPMNALLLGDNYATGVGINVRRSRLALILATSILAGTLTAFTGPIAFIGIAVPHIARLLFNTANNKILIPSTILFGSAIMLVCDILSQIPGNGVALPINSITALFGAPIVIVIILNNKKMKGAIGG